MKSSSLVRIGLLFAFLVAATVSWDAGSLCAQQLRIPTEALASDASLQEVLTEGSQLEQEGRWGEALAHYEEALRDFPGRADLQERMSLARIHYDLGRRYNDTSFVSALDQLDHRRSLDIYAEVLLKIQAHYVHTPDWHQLLNRGTRNLQVALTEPAFIERNLSHVAQPQIQQFQRELQQVMTSRGARSRNEAREQVSVAARYAWQRLQLRPQVAIMEYICGAIGALDMYSSFLTGGQLDEVMSQIEGNFVGLGIELKADDQSLLIVGVIPGGPAALGGLRKGDRIIQVDDHSTTDISTDAAADMLKGVEGSTVNLAVRAADDSVRRLTLRRARVEVPSVQDMEIVDPHYGIAYMKLTSFQKTTLRDFDAALWSLHHQGMKSLIIDVRGNPGGLLTAAVEVADKFVSGGTIVSTRGRSPREDFDYKAHAAGTWRVPLTVLIDGDSASASEIFAAAIRDHRRGTVVGQRSFGKGSVQGIFPLNVAKGGVRLTTAKFYSPNGHVISKNGVQPDVVVRSAAKLVADDVAADLEADGVAGEEKDAVLEAGMQVARHQFGQR